MNRHSMGRAPDYTDAALAAGCVNLFCLLFGLWATLGFVPVLLVALALNAAITRFDRWRNG